MTESLILLVDNDRKELGKVILIGQVAIGSAGQCRQVIDGTWTTEEASRFNFADGLQRQYARFEEPGFILAGQFQTAVIGAALRCAFAQIDWDAMARHYLEKIADGVTVACDL